MNWLETELQKPRSKAIHCSIGRRHPPGLENPKVSVVIPVYNEKNTIEEILRRVLDATVRREVIIVDDCSSDGTRQFCKIWPPEKLKAIGKCPPGMADFPLK